jgi:hypothetical protein
VNAATGPPRSPTLGRWVTQAARVARYRLGQDRLVNALKRIGADRLLTKSVEQPRLSEDQRAVHTAGFVDDLRAVEDLTGLDLSDWYSQAAV